MPNKRLTPGSIQSTDTAAICTPGWSSAHRHVSSATKDFVASEYGLSSHSGYEIDHLIPLELGGSNSVSNLWPEPYASPAGAHLKDRLENYLHDQVCYLALSSAQHQIATDWYSTCVADRTAMEFASGPTTIGSTTTTIAPTSTTVGASSICGAPANPFGYNFCGRGPYITSPNPNTCSYFNCIGNFANGTGYMTECNDETYSMSGGHSGACSDHGGPERPVYA